MISIWTVLEDLPPPSEQLQAEPEQQLPQVPAVDIAAATISELLPDIQAMSDTKKRKREKKKIAQKKKPPLSFAVKAQECNSYWD